MLVTPDTFQEFKLFMVLNDPQLKNIARKPGDVIDVKFGMSVTVDNVRLEQLLN
jgi:hypothetical protein